MSVCLTMIVRDGAATVARAINSAVPVCDYAVICDTGSRDNTVAVARQALKLAGLEGEVIHHVWRGFGLSRTDALEAARPHGEWTLMLDADDVFEGTLDGLGDDVGLVEVHLGSWRYWRRQVFRAALPWRYEGVVHEYPTLDQDVTELRLPDARIIATASGRDYLEDARLLEEYLAYHPGDTRTAFYLAQSYYDAGDFQQAERGYRARVRMGGWPEEIFYSLFRLASCLELLGRSREEIERAYAGAWVARPTRAEPLRELARLWHQTGRPEIATLASAQADQLPLPDDWLFVNREAYQ